MGRVTSPERHNSMAGPSRLRRWGIDPAELAAIGKLDSNADCPIASKGDLALTPNTARDAQTDVQWTKRASILLVEDDVLIRYTTADLLRGHGHEVIEAAHGEEARSLLASGLIVDLILSDVSMPQIDGICLTELVHKDRPGLPIILVSSSFSPEVAKLGVSFLPKPYSAQELIGAIQTVMQRSG